MRSQADGSIPKIQGPPLAGFTEWFEDDVILGAAKAPPKKVPAPSSKKPGKLPAPPRSTTVDAHGKALRSARVTAAKALKVVQQAAQTLQRHQATAPKPVHVGADLAKKISPKAQLLIKKHNQAVAKSQQAAKALAEHAVATKNAVKNLAAHIKHQHGVAVSLRKPKSGAHVGYTPEALLGYYAEIGADPDPNNPGFLTDGSPDPATAVPQTPAATTPAGMPAGTSPAGTTPDAGASVDAGLGDTTLDSPMDNGTLPPAPPMDQFISDMATVQGILYDGSQGKAPTDGFMGSYGLMSRATDIDSGVPKTAGIDPVYHYGYVFGKFHDNGPEKGIPFGDNLVSGQWNHVHGRWILGAFRASATVHSGNDGSEVVDSKTAEQSAHMANPSGMSYGPIIGNPNMPDFRGMRCDAKGHCFWLPQEAPDWLTFPLRQAAALTAQAEKKAADAAAKAAAAQAAKDKADAAAAQAAQDAQNALAESQAASEAKIAQGQAETQAKQVQVQQAQDEQQAQAQAQQEIIQQAQAQREQQTAQAQQEQEAGQILLERARRQEAYYQQHPELESAQPPQQQGGGEGEEGGEGGEGEGGYGEDARGGLMVDQGGDEEEPS